MIDKEEPDKIVGTPVRLRVKQLSSGWRPGKVYQTFYVTIPTELVRAMGWEAGDRLFPTAYRGRGVFLVRIKPELPA